MLLYLKALYTQPITLNTCFTLFWKPPCDFSIISQVPAKNLPSGEHFPSLNLSFGLPLYSKGFIFNSLTVTSPDSSFISKVPNPWLKYDAMNPEPGLGAIDEA